MDEPGLLLLCGGGLDAGHDGGHGGGRGEGPHHRNHRLERGNGSAVSDLLERRLGSVTSSDTGGNSFQPSLSFRGFNASAVMGEPQGLAVYQNGVRVNESFGDLVNWDLMPSFAINRVDILPGANPVFGLNALGGAVVMDMKTGFSFPHTELMGAGGSFGRRRAVAQHGQNTGTTGFYVGIGHTGEDGWRAHSPSNTTQAYGDVELRGNGGSGGISLGFSRSDLTGNGPAPVELLALDRHAVFTYPDSSLNSQFNLAGRGNVDLSDIVSLQASAYLRRSSHRSLNGDATNFGACNADATKLCSDPGAGETALVDTAGNAVPASAGGSGALNRSLIETTAFGVSTIPYWITATA
ncbi:MAG: TonB-dependent receptor plug domain-containing protein [Rhodospirillaceae bacterium]|nr:TonB-dependent receptor plug domain-containing protein [Rhodospirillaceae bacterium]